MIYVGTSGYSYKDWVGPFRYSVFSDKTFAAMAERTPKKLRFSVKAPGNGDSSTNRRPHAPSRRREILRRNIRPLIEQKKLSAVLMQFPNSFKSTDRTIAHLEKLRDAWDDLCLVAEFRNGAWQTGEALKLLDKLSISWCNVDQPQFKGLLHPSSDVTDGRGYVRFHGRVC